MESTNVTKNCGMIVRPVLKNNAMNPDKTREKKNDRTEKVKSPDKVETPPPPQHMDPSKKPEPPKQERSDEKRQ